MSRKLRLCKCVNMLPGLEPEKCYTYVTESIVSLEGRF